MSAPEIGTYFITGKTKAIRRTTDSNRSQRHAINLDKTLVQVIGVKSFRSRWVAVCRYRKQKMAGNNVYGDWIIYEFAITDKSDISMRKVG